MFTTPPLLVDSIRESTTALSAQARRAIAQNFRLMVTDSVACDMRRIARLESEAK